MHILLIEDDLDLGRALQAALKVEGLSSEWLRRAADAPALGLAIVQQAAARMGGQATITEGLAGAGVGFPRGASRRHGVGLRELAGSTGRLTRPRRAGMMQPP